MESLLPWKDRENIGIFKAGLRTIAKGIAFPSRVLYIDDSAPLGTEFFFFVFGIFCCIPVCVINIVDVLLKNVFPDAFYFQDINPYTIIIAVPLQFLIGPIELSIFAFSYKLVSGSVPSITSDIKLKAAWYIGTYFLLFLFWWLGFGIALYSTEIWNKIDRDETLLTLSLILAVILWIRIAISCTKVSLAVSYSKAFIIVLFASVLFIVINIPIGFILSILLQTVFSNF